MTAEKARTTLIKIRLSGACFPEDNPESALDMAIEALERNSPCDLCRFNPPSSTDEKPCSMCPAVAIEEAGE